MDVTLDGNCLLDLEAGRSSHADHLAQIRAMADAGALDLRVVAIGASERQPDGVYARDLAEFRARLAAIGLEDATILRPPFQWGIGFPEWSHWPDPMLKALERQVHAILYDAIDYRWGEFMRSPEAERHPAAAYACWCAARCNVLAMTSHIYAGGDLFISRDERFWWSDAPQRLRRLGAGEILTPREATERLAGDHLRTV
jgi:hypothetical protein